MCVRSNTFLLQRSAVFHALIFVIDLRFRQDQSNILSQSAAIELQRICKTVRILDWINGDNVGSNWLPQLTYVRTGFDEDIIIILSREERLCGWMEQEL